MDVFAQYLMKIQNPQNREIVYNVLSWVQEKFPHLEGKIAWNQPMFTDHGTFIIGFSTAKYHLAVSPEKECIAQFSDEIKKSGYQHTDNLIRIPWDSEIDFKLLEKMIRFNIEDKAECKTFWRK